MNKIKTIKSKINPLLTLDYMLREPENKYFDRKSARIRSSNLASLISAFQPLETPYVNECYSDEGK